MASPPRRPWAGFGARSSGKPADEPVADSQAPRDEEHPYAHHDPIPVPDAEERNTETTWALFSELSASEEARFAETAPASLPMRLRARETRGGGPASEPPGFSPTVPAQSALPEAETQGGFAMTVPASLMHLTRPNPERAPARAQPKGVSLDDALTLARQRNRVCPRPDAWRELWQLLGQLQPQSATADPPLPLAGAAWSDTPHLSKRMVFRSQIEWAAENGCLEQLVRFLNNLPETQWHHFGE